MAQHATLTLRAGVRPLMAQERPGPHANMSVPLDTCYYVDLELQGNCSEVRHRAGDPDTVVMTPTTGRTLMTVMPEVS